MPETYLQIELIIELIKEQEPHRLDLISQLKKSNKTKWLRQAYIPLVSDESANNPGTEWQFDENIILEHEFEGTIVLDVLKNGRIGGIELLSQIRD